MQYSSNDPKHQSFIDLFEKENTQAFNIIPKKASWYKVAHLRPDRTHIVLQDQQKQLSEIVFDYTCGLITRDGELVDASFKADFCQYFNKLLNDLKSQKAELVKEIAS